MGIAPAVYFALMWNIRVNVFDMEIKECDFSFGYPNNYMSTVTLNINFYLLLIFFFFFFWAGFLTTII
jgi:hypothetical protein